MATRLNSNAVRLLVASLAGLALGGACSSTPQLMPTPRVYLNRPTSAFTQIPEPLQTNLVDVLFVTDRKPAYDPRRGYHYTYGRSASLAFGRCEVDIGQGAPWTQLRDDSLEARRQNRWPLTLRAIHETGRFPPTPFPAQATNASLVLPADIQAQHTAATQVFHHELRRRLALTPRKEAYVFVHGFNNDFAWANVLTAQLWHFLQREGVPIAYTWPAGRGGLRGYAYDRESGEFTVHHLKQCLRLLFSCPDLERIHLMAHSRGADVLTSALRELAIERQGAGAPLPFLPRIANLILVAPDLDLEVAGQRLSAEYLDLAVRRMTLYVCREDRAITLANWLFEGVRRLGIIRPSDFSPEQRALIQQRTTTQIVDARVDVSFLGHGYFYENPAVSADLMLLLREDCDPGPGGCRPLSRDESGTFWMLTNDYPLGRSAD